jgi:SAM-dependent methyltransferase
MNNYLSQLKSDYEKIWENLSKSVYQNNIVQSRRTDRSLYYNVVLKYLENLKNPLVIELGCGTGIDLNIISEQNSSINPFASDLSVKSIQICHNISSDLKNEVKLFVSNTLLLPLKNCQFDVVFSQGLIEHFKNPITVIKEHMRVLKTGGYLIINVPQKYTGYTRMKKKKMRQGKWKLGWETEFSYNDLKKIGKNLELKEIEVSGYQYWKSWKEPAFVFRDFYDKFHRRNPLKNRKIFKVLRNWYESFWKKLEDKWGYYFLQNIIIVFQKK